MTKEQPAVGVVIGSDSDLAAMQRCLDQLDQFAIPYEVRVISAHRTPQVAHEYAGSAAGRGLKVIIAAAGMSAALAGTLAADRAFVLQVQPAIKIAIPYSGEAIGYVAEPVPAVESIIPDVGKISIHMLEKLHVVVTSQHPLQLRGAGSGGRQVPLGR